MNWVGIIIVLMIIGGIVTIIRNIATKINVAINKSSNPEKAMDALEDAYTDEAMTAFGYESQLIKIAESSKSPEAALKLVEFYTNEKKDPQKAQYWSKRAIQCGNIEAMANYYGFTDYDVSYSNHAEILSALNNVKGFSNETRYTVNYYKGLVYYKSGDIEQAKQMFISCKQIGAETQSISSNGKYKNNCDYMLYLCYYKEKNIDEAEKMVAALKENKFDISADHYLNLYNYYVEKRSGGNPNYEKEISYAGAYAECTDCDRQKAMNILGDSYYSMAQSYEAGINGYEKDLEKAVECYDCAAEFEHTEAMYYIGIHSWIADNHARDYFQANYYLRMAESKGHQKAGEFLSQYGVEKILITPYQLEEKTYKFHSNHHLTVSADTMKALHIRAGVQCSVSRITKMFSDSYERNIKSFDNLMSNVHQLYADHVALMLKWCISLLMHFGIDSYSSQDIIEMCEDLSLLPRVPVFEQGIEKIDRRAEELHLETVYSKATRGYWTGSGFGTTIGGTIKASVNASIAAGVMNIGSGILEGIGDGIIASMNNSEIKNMGKALFEKKSTKSEFQQAVMSACLDVSDVVLEILEKHCGIKISLSEGDIIFGDEVLKTINNRALDAKIENNITAKKYEYAYALLIEKLRRNPFDYETFRWIVSITTMSNLTIKDEEAPEAIKHYAGDFMIDLPSILNDLGNAVEVAGAKLVETLDNA